MLVAIDDAQWIDRASGRALGHAFRRLPAATGVLLSIRTESDGPPQSGIEQALSDLQPISVSVEPLSSDLTATLLKDALGVELPRKQLQEIHRQSDGNPFYAMEFARAAQRGEGRPTGLRLPVPRGLRDDVIRHRFGGLSASASDVALIASAATRPTVQLLHRVLTPEAVEEGLGQAEEAGLLRVDAGAVRFTHPLYRSAIYADTSRVHRHRIHARIAEVVDDEEERGRHLALSTDIPDEAIAGVVERAASSAAAHGAPDEASELFGHAIRLTPATEPSALARRLLASGSCRFQAGDASQGVVDVLRAVDLAPSGAVRAQALATLGSMEEVVHRLSESRRHLELALDEVEISPEVRCTTHAALQGTTAALGDLAAADAHAIQALSIAHTIDDTPSRARAYAAAARTRARRSDGGLEELMDDAPELWGPIDELPVHDWPRTTLVQERLSRGDLAGARDVAEWSLDAADVRGDEPSRQILLSMLATVDAHAGRWAEGLAHAREASAVAEQLGNATQELALVAWSRPGSETPTGHERTRNAPSPWRTMSPASGPRPRRSKRSVSWSCRAAWRGRASTGSMNSRSIDASQMDRPSFRYRTWSKRSWGSPRSTGPLTSRPASKHLRATCSSRRSRCEHAASSWKQRTTLTAPKAHSRTPWIDISNSRCRSARRGRCLCSAEFGAAPRKRDARVTLEQADALFEALPAPLWRDRVADELGHIAGRRPTRDRLTDAEHRVAYLAAAGSRNREVAEQLHMSTRTVEGHLSTVYAKLGLRSRTELALFFDATESEMKEPPETGGSFDG